MFRRLGIAVVLAVMLATAGVAAGHVKAHYDTELTKPRVREHPGEYGGQLVVAVRLSSGSRHCYVGREVTLYRENGSVDVSTDSAYTDAGGRAVFYDYGPQAFYYVRAEKRVGYTYVCPSRRSVVSSAF